MKTRNPIAVLRNAARNSPWFVMAAALHMIVIAGAAIFYTSHESASTEDVTFQITSKPRPVNVEEPIVPEVPPDRHAIPAQEDDPTLVDVEVWTPTDLAPSTDTDVGDPNSLFDTTTGDVGSTAIGPGRVGFSGDGVSSHTPKTPGHVRRGLPGGGTHTAVTEAAVLDGMLWLARHQNPDGSWGAKTMQAQCMADSPCCDPKANVNDQHDLGLTSLALLCYLGAGYGHDARTKLVDDVTGKTYRIGDIVKGGLRWLANKQNPDGSFSSGRVEMYNEALATMAMCEGYSLGQNRIWRQPAQRALDFVQAAQKPNPSGTGTWGWRYAPRQEVEDFRRETGDVEAYRTALYDADTSVTGWAIMALKSGQLAGLDVRDDALQGGFDYCQWATADDGLVGYVSPKGAGDKVTGVNDQYEYHPGTMTALGMCIRIFTRHDAADPFFAKAAKRLVADLPKISKDKLSIDYYYWYYGSLALNQFDGPDSPARSGKFWGAWNKAMVDALVTLQDHHARSCNRGGWLTPDRWSYAGGPIYSTAMGVLTLEVYYRYANAFGSVRTGKAKASDVDSSEPAKPQPVK